MPTNAELTKMVEAQASEISGLKEKLDGIDDLKSMIEGLTSTMAKNNPVTRTQGAMDAPEYVNEDAGVAEFNEEADYVQLVKPKIEGDDDIERAAMWEKKKGEILEFMSQPLDIEIHSTSDEDADQVFMVAVNGRQKVFMRGHKYQNVPRYIVEVLARAKPITYLNEQYKKADGTDAVRWPGKSGLRYPFSVLRDPDPRGRVWLQSVLQRAA